MTVTTADRVDERTTDPVSEPVPDATPATTGPPDLPPAQQRRRYPRGTENIEIVFRQMPAGEKDQRRRELLAALGAAPPDRLVEWSSLDVCIVANVQPQSHRLWRGVRVPVDSLDAFPAPLRTGGRRGRTLYYDARAVHRWLIVQHKLTPAGQPTNARAVD